jgi:hypothetical protein
MPGSYVKSPKEDERVWQLPAMTHEDLRMSGCLRFLNLK